MTTVALFILLFGCMLLGVPIALALGLSSIATILMFSNDSLASIALKLFEALSKHYTLLAIPFFIMSSAFLSTGGVAKRIIRFATSVVGHIKGGVAMASVMACMIFAAVSGSSPATVAAIGSICIVGMNKVGYPQSFGAGVITTAGTLGILIPPSIVMLVYSAATEVSAARMFMAGFLPGLMMGFMLMIAIYIVAYIRKIPSQPWTGFKEIFVSGWSALGGLMLIIIVLGSIYGGIASPTEAAAVSAVYAFGVAIFGYRDIGPLRNQPWKREGEGMVNMIGRNLWQIVYTLPKCIFDKDVNKVLVDASKVSIMLLFIIANAMLFAHVLTTERIPHHLAAIIVELGLSPWMFLIVVNLLSACCRKLHGAFGDSADHGADSLSDRRAAGHRSDSSGHHHGGEYGNRHADPAGWSEPVRNGRNHRQEYGVGNQGGPAMVDINAHFPGIHHIHSADISLSARIY